MKYKGEKNFIVIGNNNKLREYVNINPGTIQGGTITKIADNEEYKIPPTIDDPTLLVEIKEDLIKNNILKLLKNSKKVI